MIVVLRHRCAQGRAKCGVGDEMSLRSTNDRSRQAQLAALWWRARIPIGADTVNPAKWRSSSDSPAQNPYSRWSRANSRQGLLTGHVSHSLEALASRRARAWGRSALGGKNRRVFPVQAASSRHRSLSMVAVAQISAMTVGMLPSCGSALIGKSTPSASI
jgi:hypothetical protein